MNIMIVEDNAKMRKMIHKVIIDGVKDIDSVFEFRDGEDAINYYRKLKPDWVTMDIRMEPMNGLTASQKIIENDAGARIIIVTHYSDVAYREKAKNIGIYAYVLKENLTDLPALIKSIL